MDVVIEAIGNPITFELALSFVRDGGKAIMVGIAPLGSTGKVDITRVVRRNVSLAVSCTCFGLIVPITIARFLSLVHMEQRPEKIFPLWLAWLRWDFWMLPQ